MGKKSKMAAICSRSINKVALFLTEYIQNSDFVVYRNVLMYFRLNGMVRKYVKHCIVGQKANKAPCVQGKTSI